MGFASSLMQLMLAMFGGLGTFAFAGAGGSQSLDLTPDTKTDGEVTSPEEEAPIPVEDSEDAAALEEDDTSAPQGQVMEAGNRLPTGEAVDLAPQGGSIQVVTGRVTTLDHDGADVESIRILKGPAQGNVTVNPDNSMALVLSETQYVGKLEFSYEVTLKGGATQIFKANLDAVPGTQQGGWGQGDHYMLETDENDDVIVEHGDNHRKVFVSGSEDALTRADIAALEGLTVDKITSAWLLKNPEYGGSEDMALASDAGMLAWRGMVGTGKAPGSHALLFERGYEYKTGDFLHSGMAGESELHPLYIGAYGEGEKPEILDPQKMTKLGNENIVVQGLHFSGGFMTLRGTNLLMDDMTMTDEAVIRNIDGFTFRNSDITEVHREEAPRDYWDPHPSRISGLFMSGTSNALIENNLADHSGWVDGYQYDLSADSVQPPSKYSHNFYLATNNSDVTFRDNVVMRGAGSGAQIRSGGFVEDNLFLDNNGGLFVGAGGTNEAGTLGFGNYSLVLDNVVTSGAHKRTADGEGALTAGLSNNGFDGSLVGNIITHLANPNDPTELAWKQIAHKGLNSGRGTHYDDSILYNWAGSKNYLEKLAITQNIDGLDKAVLNQTTIQNFAGLVLGKKTATIAELADFLRDNADAALDDVVDADIINSFFQIGFGLYTTIRAEEETLRFVPNDLGDGIRWDNRLNWSTADLPGTQDGDSVDLAGNWVRYGGTTRLDDLDLGEGGKLTVGSGALRVEDELAVGSKGGRIDIDGAGQFWTDGYGDSDTISINVMGGRFANTGIFKGDVRMVVGDNAQAILATDDASFDLNKDSRLEIRGGDADVGFDGGDGIATLRMTQGAELRFTAEAGKLGHIGEFRSGALGNDMNDLTSGINLGSGTLSVNVTGMASGAMDWVLMEADEIIGNVGKLNVTGLGTGRDATVNINYDTDTVTLQLGAAGAGTGKVGIKQLGKEQGFLSNPADAEAKALWDALTADHGVLSDDPIHEDEDDLIAAE